MNSHINCICNTYKMYSEFTEGIDILYRILTDVSKYWVKHKKHNFVLEHPVNSFFLAVNRPVSSNVTPLVRVLEKTDSIYTNGKIEDNLIKVLLKKC